MEAGIMTWGIPTDVFLQIHIIVSLVGILSGFLVLYGLLTGRPFGGWTALFLATTVLTSVTGFALPPFGFDPARAVGVISLVLLAMAVAALYAFRLAGAWRWMYIGSAVAALYLNVFVGVTQAFQKRSYSRWRQPNQSPRFLSLSSPCSRSSSRSVFWQRSGSTPTPKQGHRHIAKNRRSARLAPTYRISGNPRLENPDG
jgi:hypothetical protein